MKNLKLVARETKKHTIVNVCGVEIGRDFVVIAGPCSVESEKQLLETARAVRAAGADMLRGGAFKPRTSPYDFQGLGIQGLKILEKAKQETGLPIVTEVVDPRDVSWVAGFSKKSENQDARCFSNAVCTPPSKNGSTVPSTF